MNFISHSVLLGFTSGAAVLIVFKQLPGLLGIHIEKGSGFIRSLLDLVAHLDQFHLLTFVLGLIVIAVVLAIKRWRPGWPGTLIAMVLVGILLTFFHLDNRGVRVVGAISGSLPPFHLPNWELWHQIGTLAPAALAITILGLMEANSISQIYSGPDPPAAQCESRIYRPGVGQPERCLF